MISTATRKVAISIERIRAGSPIWGRSSKAAAMADWLWYSAGTNLIEVFGSIQSSAAGPPSLGRSNGPETCWKKPISPSKSGAGPVMPSAASRAAKTPLRAAKANAQPFHIDSSPARVSRRAVPVVPAIPSAWTVCSCESPSSFDRGQRRGDRAVGRVVPAAGADAGGVAEPALGLVGDRRGGDPGAAVGAGELRRRPSRPPSCRSGAPARARDRCRCNPGSGYARRWRTPPSRARRPAADQRDRRRPSRPPGDPARDRRRGLRRAPDGTAQRVQQPAPGLDDHGLGQVLERVASANAASRSARVSDIARPHCRFGCNDKDVMRTRVVGCDRPDLMSLARGA